MPLTSDPLTILLAYDTWATHRLLEHARPLTRDQFHQRFPIGEGSLHNNFTHIIGTMRRWSDRLAERPLRPVLLAIADRPDIAHESADRTVAQLLDLLAAASTDLAAITRDVRARDALASTLSLDWPAEGGGANRYTFSRAAVILHVCNHGTHHRAQCLNMFRHLNIPGLSNKLPETDLVDWQAETESPPVRL